MFVAVLCLSYFCPLVCCNWAGMFFLSIPGTRSCSQEVNIELNKFPAHLHLPVCTLQSLQGWTNTLLVSSSALSPPWKMLPNWDRVWQGHCQLLVCTHGSFSRKKLSLQSRKLLWNISLPLASPALGHQKNGTELSHVACLYSLFKCLLLTSTSNLLDACSGFDESVLNLYICSKIVTYQLGSVFENVTAIAVTDASNKLTTQIFHWVVIHGCCFSITSPTQNSKLTATLLFLKRWRLCPRWL